MAGVETPVSAAPSQCPGAFGSHCGIVATRASQTTSLSPENARFSCPGLFCLRTENRDACCILPEPVFLLLEQKHIEAVLFQNQMASALKVCCRLKHEYPRRMKTQTLLRTYEIVLLYENSERTVLHEIFHHLRGEAPTLRRVQNQLQVSCEKTKSLFFPSAFGSAQDQRNLLTFGDQKEWFTDSARAENWSEPSALRQICSGFDQDIQYVLHVLEVVVCC